MSSFLNLATGFRFKNPTHCVSAFFAGSGSQSDRLAERFGTGHVLDASGHVALPFSLMGAGQPQLISALNGPWTVVSASLLQLPCWCGCS